jgi:hypothetical protein
MIWPVKEGVIGGFDLWTVGFHRNTLNLIQLMSGLVDVHHVWWENNSLYFIVSRKDPAGVLFISGLLHATKVDAVKLVKQHLLFDLTEEK